MYSITYFHPKDLCQPGMMRVDWHTLHYIPVVPFLNRLYGYIFAVVTPECLVKTAYASVTC